MLRAESDRLRLYALRTAFSAFVFFGYTVASHAQSEPPLGVPLAGALPGLASSGCDAGLAAGAGSSATPARTGRFNAGSNTASDLGVPLYGSPNAGTNLPVYSN